MTLNQQLAPQQLAPAERIGTPPRLIAGPPARPWGGSLLRLQTVVITTLVAALLTGGALWAQAAAAPVARAAAAPASPAVQAPPPPTVSSTPPVAAIATPAPTSAAPLPGSVGSPTVRPGGGSLVSPLATPSPAPTPQPVPVVPAQALIAGFPSVTQWYHLDCEYAAAAAVTRYWGHLVSQQTFVSAVPSNPNPHLGFRGAIDGAFGGLTDYGVYAEALVPVLAQHGYNAVPFYGGAARLTAEVAAGHPVVVWISTGKYVSRARVVASAGGQTFTLVTGEHAVVVYGYDRGGVSIMDVSDGRFTYISWAAFLTDWGYFDQMALVITPQ